MWHWLNCYLSRRHEFGVWCEPGSIFLRCVHCGRRSPGWALGGGHPPVKAGPPARPASRPNATGQSTRPSNVVPVNQIVAG
jgi:hypothetical protein